MKTTMWLPWTSPPIRSNNRMHWARKAAQVKLVRIAAAVQSRGLEPITGPVSVTLIWEVTDHRRRDVGASGPTLKAWIGGCVEGGLFAGDSHDVVAEERLRIEIGTRKGVRVEIEAWQPPTSALLSNDRDAFTNVWAAKVPGHQEAP